MKYHEFSEVQRFETSASIAKHFWHSINLWNERPNLINKRLIGCEVLLKFNLNNITLVDEIVNILQQKLLLIDNSIDCIFHHLLTNYNQHISLETSDDSLIVFFIRRFLPKSVNIEKQQSDVEIAILDYVNGQATFLNKLLDDSKSTSTTTSKKHYSYRIKFKDQSHCDRSCSTQDDKSNYIILLVDQETRDVGDRIDAPGLSSNLNWVKCKLVPKIVNWCDQASKVEANTGDNDPHQLNKGSLKLVNINDYCLLYQRLKDVYGKSFVKIWPENTDPLKYVYEDVAIATYLLLLWRHKKQTFVDLGCGNGLLVHILTSEGHNGLGIDVRSRKIWDLYPDGTANLQVKTITPTSDDSCLYPDADWLIGNHSDELTPWIPVLASMSSYDCKFFLLPCCSYELNGQKYQRQNSSKSQYMDYLDHIAELSRHCGFNVAFDKLRIPSTKRICMIGSSRTYSICDQIDKANFIRSLIESKCGVTGKELSSNDSRYGNFKTRSNEIKVRNCTQLNKDFVKELVALIAKKLLNSSSIQSCLIISDEESRDTSNSLKRPQWNEGASIALSELAKSLPIDCLKKLKRECGGLQTLIKNHHYIFRIDKGHVHFRKPLSINSCQSDNRKTACFKAKSCWFFDNHPDRCPLSNEDCPYKHS